jgi:predicted short-subunit dehydrogenase-like oxidoreductase (DUF2520 family)
MGLALGQALLDAGATRHLEYWGRRPEAPAHPLFHEGRATYRFGLHPVPPDTGALFLTPPDDVLVELAHAVAGQGHAPAGCAAFHCSGALSGEVLTPLHARGFTVGSFHPLQAVAHPVIGARRIPGAAVAVAGEAPAVAAARRLAAALGSPVLEVPVARRPLYHAAAVLASNGVVALLAVAVRLLTRCGVEGDEALAALLALTRGAVENVAELGLDAGITGPAVRGDLETVSLHLRSLTGTEREAYRAVGVVLTELARLRGMDEARLAGLMELFDTGRPAPGPPGTTGT